MYEQLPFPIAAEPPGWPHRREHQGHPSQAAAMVTALLVGGGWAKNGRGPDHDWITICPIVTSIAVGQLQADRGCRSALLELAIIETAPAAEVVAQLTKPELLGSGLPDLHTAIEMEEHLPALLSGLTP